MSEFKHSIWPRMLLNTYNQIVSARSSPRTAGHCGPGQRSGAAETGEEGRHQADCSIGVELLHGEERRTALHTWSPCSDTKHTYIVRWNIPTVYACIILESETTMEKEMMATMKASWKVAP